MICQTFNDESMKLYNQFSPIWIISGTTSSEVGKAFAGKGCLMICLNVELNPAEEIFMAGSMWW